MGFLNTLFGDSSKARIKKVRPLVDRIVAMRPEMMALSDAELRAKTEAFRARLKQGETLDDLLCEAFAVVREAARRTVEMEHFEVQLIGGVVLHQGSIAEMKTGEGKTLVATLPAYLNALNGEGVHVVTVNDYLARRDAQWMGKIYRFLGLTVGCVIAGQTPDQKQAAYRCDVTYGTNNEFGFDYLRDNREISRDYVSQRGLVYAIVDEVDSILIDEARTPLIISGIGEASSDQYDAANRFVRGLTKGKELVEQLSTERMLGEASEEDGDYQCDLKKRTVQLTARGISKAESYFSVAGNLGDPENMELNHYILQALKANALFARDRDYIVKDGQVLIVDEFTGRIMYGRRYSDGLHQALEAKEGVKIEHENQTIATITLQNYFRMYAKLAGMTGTAKTEENEFVGIYGMDVVEIPTNRELMRNDMPDAIYVTEKGKFDGIVETIKRVHETGQPILVGTISVERSEYLSERLSRAGLREHEVLNAKQHEREAEIVAQAGRKGRITIATNMAGRGTDILLGGNPDFLTRSELMREGMESYLIEEAAGHGDTSDPDVADARAEYARIYAEKKQITSAEHDEVEVLGGLFILGTERHESRRVDNQLRGRAGRQGDHGTTQFCVSLEDDMIAHFAGDRTQRIVNFISADGQADDIKAEYRFLSKTIEIAQKRVEARNAEMRKNTLRYDDVMNKQREIIYSQRRRVLDGEDVYETIQSMLHESLDEIIEQNCNANAPREDWHLHALQTHVCAFCGASDTQFIPGAALETITPEQVRERVYAFAEMLYKKGEEFTEAKKHDPRELERTMLLRTVDMAWVQHLESMDELKQGIGLRAYAQSDPINAFTSEGFDLFDAMVADIRRNTVHNIFINFWKNAVVVRSKVGKETGTTSAKGAAEPFKREEKRIGRNEKCPCGSGQKYKNCCGKGK